MSSESDPADLPAPSENSLRASEAERRLVSLVLESYRLSTLLTTVLAQLDLVEQKKYGSRFAFILQRMQGILEDAQLRIVPLEDSEFDEGMAVSAVNLSDFEAGDVLIVDKVVEPLIMGTSGVVHPGVISVKRREA